MAKASPKEKIIKSRERVKQHGEVFTPRHIVNDMISMPGLKDTIREFKTTVLEPACGEGVFLVEILKKRLDKAKAESQGDIVIYENLALLSLSTLYGVELQEDNAQNCVMNLLERFIDDYSTFARSLAKKPKAKVKDSAKKIISANIVEGNFLTRETNGGKPIVFSEWRVKPARKGTKNISVSRTEHTLEDILAGLDNPDGYIYDGNLIEEKSKDDGSLMDDLFASLYEDAAEIEEKVDRVEEKPKRFVTVNLIDVYDELWEEIDDGEGSR